MVCRRTVGRPSAGFRPLQSRVPRSGLVRGYAALAPDASPLSDASTARGEEAASTLTLLPKQRGREQAGGCQLLRFAACLTRPDGTSARVPWCQSPVETTHPHRASGSRPTGRASYAIGGGLPSARRPSTPRRRVPPLGRVRQASTSAHEARPTGRGGASWLAVSAGRAHRCRSHRSGCPPRLRATIRSLGAHASREPREASVGPQAQISPTVKPSGKGSSSPRT